MRVSNAHLHEYPKGIHDVTAPSSALQNPLEKKDRVEGFVGIRGHNPKFRGLALSVSQQCLVDGQQGAGWWASLGVNRHPPGKDTFPGPHCDNVKCVELYAKV